jgi:2-polyprenyl-6-methoxyphenol hydroxylase-like FAD-dependent oxidoreductase
VGAQGLNLAIRDSIVAANHLIPAFLDEVRSDDLDQVTFNIESERITEIQTIQKIQARPPKILLRDTWWTKMLFRIITALGRGRSIIAPSDGVFGKIAWGVSEVKWSGGQ